MVRASRKGAEGGGGSGERGFQVLSPGGFSFRIDYDLVARRATVAGHAVDLAESNVLLLDSVEVATGPTLAGTRLSMSRIEDQLRPETHVIRDDAVLYDTCSAICLCRRSTIRRTADPADAGRLLRVAETTLTIVNVAS